MYLILITEKIILQRNQLVLNSFFFKTAAVVVGDFTALALALTSTLVSKISDGRRMFDLNKTK